MMNISPISATDFYKTGHNSQYPEGTTFVYSNGTCRSDKHFKGLPDFDHKVVNFGLQGICQWLLIDYWNEKFFNQPKRKVCGRYYRTISKALNQPNFSIKHVEALHDLGYLPVTIKALPEGARVNIKVPTYTIYNTHDDFFWVTNYLETQIQAESWKCKVAATTAFEYRRLFTKYAIDTGVDLSFVDFQGHDFSMRGMSGIQDPTQCGAGHLLSFKGTDTITAIEYHENYYQGMGAYILEDDDTRTSKKLEKLLDNLYRAGVKNVVDVNDWTGDPQFMKIVYNANEKWHYSLEEIDDPRIFVGGSVPATEHAVAGTNIIDIEQTLLASGKWNGLTVEMLQGLQPLPDFK